MADEPDYGGKGDPASPIVLRLLNHLDKLCISSFPQYSALAPDEQLPEFRHDWAASQPSATQYFLQQLVFTLAFVAIVCVYSYSYPDQRANVQYIFLLFLLALGWSIIDFLRIAAILKDKRYGSDLIRQLLAGTIDFDAIYRRIPFPFQLLYARRSGNSFEQSAVFLVRNLDWFVLKPKICFRFSWIIMSAGIIMALAFIATWISGGSFEAYYIPVFLSILLVVFGFTTERWRLWSFAGHVVSLVERDYLLTKRELEEERG